MDIAIIKTIQSYSNIPFEKFKYDDFFNDKLLMGLSEEIRRILIKRYVYFETIHKLRTHPRCIINEGDCELRKKGVLENQERQLNILQEGSIDYVLSDLYASFKKDDSTQDIFIKVFENILDRRVPG